MQWPPTGASDNSARFGLAARVLKALANASIFLFLALPFVLLSNCGGDVASFTGYQALGGVSVPITNEMQPPVYISYGPDWWIAGLIILAAVGLASAWRGGVAWSLAGLGAAITSFIVLQAAVGFFNSPAALADVEVWNATTDQGGTAAGLAYVGVTVIELGSIATRSWYEIRQSHGAPPDGRWLAIGLVTTGLLVLMGIGLLALGGLILALHG